MKSSACVSRKRMRARAVRYTRCVGQSCVKRAFSHSSLSPARSSSKPGARLLQGYDSDSFGLKTRFVPSKTTGRNRWVLLLLLVRSCWWSSLCTGREARVYWGGKENEGQGASRISLTHTHPLVLAALFVDDSGWVGWIIMDTIYILKFDGNPCKHTKRKSERVCVCLCVLNCITLFPWSNNRHTQCRIRDWPNGLPETNKQFIIYVYICFFSQIALFWRV